MRSFFEGIQSLFVDFLFAPLDVLRHTENNTGYWGWWFANIFSWIAIGVCAYFVVYWCKQLKIHQDNNEENQDTTAHSFLK
ncbi:MAG: uracil phosphoribosyltransferase [Flavobacterium sp. JAD_PAG50586_2]|nr:MAG: uracil phosphoribosyltransferase [Flavobacterium sp. JAD_PAG50586_2]